MNYLIGDVQGCCDALDRLLAKIDFSPSRDHLWVLGDLINRGGNKIFPDEVEEVLLAVPAVREVAVVGHPDDRLGEVPVDIRPRFVTAEALEAEFP